LSNITRLKTLTGRRVGFSDHSEGPEAFFWAALVGATIFEKHFTTDNSLVGPDQKMSANPEVFRRAVDNVARAFDVLGESRAAPFVSEMGAIPMRTRS
jgi:sialic acid synthase SpsE